MTDPNPSPEQEPKSQSTQDAWRDVGRQFQDMGDSLARAFRAAWQDEGNRQRVEEMRTGVESMVNQVGQVLRDYSETPEGQHLHSEAKRAAESLRTVGEQTVTEVRPHLVVALRQVNAELQRMINQMDNPPQPSSNPDEAPRTGNEPPRQG
jgi:ElaB/YqjD/DUF883 family membrane-anchored ribosome-binding protein